ncbi:MAG: class I SAM-dependent methyltransferase [Bacteroidota bacterium]
MLSREEKKQYRSQLFCHLDGLVVPAVAYSLKESGLLDVLIQQERMQLSELSERYAANEGYLNVALRVLAAQGWLNYEVDSVRDEVSVATNEKSALAFGQFGLYKDVVHLLQFSGNFHRRKFEIEPFRVLEQIYQKYGNRYGLDFSEDSELVHIQKQILQHIEGFLVGPTVVLLGMGGMFHKYFMEASFQPSEYHKDPESFAKILDFLSALGWFNKNRTTYQFTDKGLFFAKRSSAYGVTVSYLPTFRRMKDLLFGDPSVLWTKDAQGAELHVDRAMNVWGSGGAHSAYFKKIDDIIIDVFNQPLDLQPRGILDMGCGNGAFLIHLFDVIEQRTLRGEHLEEYPLFLVGVDYNDAALKITRANLIQADIWAKVIWGDIGDPERLAHDLKTDYDIELKELLNVRTFLDHNRIWSSPQNTDSLPNSDSTGAFAYRGKRLNNSEVAQNLREHLNKWLPYVAQFGLLLIELHTIAPSLTAENIGRTAATAYDATHGFSDQYILELPQLLQIAEEVGLHSEEKYFSKFPNSDLATVSINYFRGA